MKQPTKQEFTISMKCQELKISFSTLKAILFKTNRTLKYIKFNKPP